MAFPGREAEPWRHLAILRRLATVLVIAALTIPLGLDLSMPVPEDNPITAETIAQGRALFNDRHLSPDAITPGIFGRRGTRHPPR